MNFLVRQATLAPSTIYRREEFGKTDHSKGIVSLFRKSQSDPIVTREHDLNPSPDTWKDAWKPELIPR